MKRFITILINTLIKNYKIKIEWKNIKMHINSIRAFPGPFLKTNIIKEKEKEKKNPTHIKKNNKKNMVGDCSNSKTKAVFCELLLNF